MSWQPSKSLFSMRDVIPNDIVDEFITSVYKSEWNYGIPGGFLTNKPNRWTNTYGDGAKIDNSGKLDSSGWPSTFWTAMINKSNVTLETKTESMPDSFCKIVPYLRSLFLHVCPDANINDNTFNIALSNYYTDPNMKIAGHTDCNVWYPDECSLGPVFASITLYPFDKPTIIDNYCRFQIKKPYNLKRIARTCTSSKGTWETVYLPHESILIMPSTVHHRVMPHTKTKQHLFLPRINITFRSTYPIEINPLMNAMGVANHTRYYKPPKRLLYPYVPNTDISDDIKIIIETFNEYLSKNNKPLLDVQAVQKTGYKKIYKEYYEQYIKNKSLMPIPKYSSNIVMELIQMVCIYLSKN